MVRLVGLIAVLGLTAAGGLSAATAPATAPAGMMEEGKIQSITSVLNDLVQLTVEGKSLRLDRGHWDDASKGKSREDLLEQRKKDLIARGLPEGVAGKYAGMPTQSGTGTGVEMLVKRLETAAGGLGSSRSSNGQVERMMFTGRGLSVVLFLGATFRITLQEEDSPSRTLDFADDGEGNLRVTIVSPESGTVLLLNQDAKGKIKIVHVDANDTVRLEGESFLALYGTNRQYADGRLFPLLKHMGLGLPMTPYSAAVKVGVLDLLRRPITEADAIKAKSLIKDLDDKSSAKREEATKALTGDILRYQKAVSEASKDENGSLEAKERLRKIVEDSVQTRRVGDMISALGLTEDVMYLSDLLAEAKDADREIIVSALKRLTKQDFGTDPAAWRKWLSQRKGG